MSNVINYSKPSATVFKLGIKGSVCRKHTTRWSAETLLRAGEEEPGSPDPGPTERGGQLPKTPWFRTTPTRARAEHLKALGSSPSTITNSTPGASSFTFLNYKTGMVMLKTSLLSGLVPGLEDPKGYCEPGFR